MSLVRSVWNAVGSLLGLARKHLIISLIVIAALGYGGYRAWASLTSTSGETTYTLGTVASSTIVASLSETGQIAATNSVGVQPQVSGTITHIYVTAGQKVAAGQVLVTLDSTDAANKVAQAEAALATAKLQYQHDSAQAPIDFQKAQDTLSQDRQNLADDYTATYADISSVFLNLPAVVTGTQDALFGYEMSSNRSQWNTDILVNLFQNQDARAQAQKFADAAKSDYQAARAAYDAALAAYKTTSRSSDTATVDALLLQSNGMANLVAQAVQSELNFLNTVNDLAQQFNVQLPSYATTLSTNERTYLTTANNAGTTLTSDRKTITTAKQAITTDQQNITLLQVGNTDTGSNPISLQVSAANIQADEQNLQQLKETLAQYTVRAPISGTVASVASVSVGDTANGTLATIVTPQQIAEVSVNEVDAAQIKVGEKATLTFDAISDLTMTGTVSSIDTVGTVSQGVVSYTVKIALDTQDERVKPGMTVNAAIITATKTDVLAVPSSAVKTSGGRSYVLAFEPAVSGTTITTATAPTQIPVTTGISDDTQVEITSGLTVGAQIVVKSSSATQTTTSTRTSTLGGPGLRL